MKKQFSHKCKQIFTAVCLVLCLTAFYSCKKDSTDKGTAVNNAEGIEETVERGPAKVTLTLDKKEISIADRINLSIVIDIEEDYEVELPAFGEKLEQFGIVDYHNSQPELKGNDRKLLKRTYVLEPFLSGDYPIHPMKIQFYKKGDDAPVKHFVETPEVSVKVKSLLPEDMKDLALNEIEPPLSYPRSYTLWILSGAGAVLLLIIASGIYYYRKRTNKIGSIDAVLSAHDIAYNELRTLVDENLIDKGEIKQFYLRLSAIIRRYIENRFGLKAPEQTTEEFLSGLEKANNFPDQYKPLLNDFLRHCDLVKFAKFEPGTEDIQKSFDSCKAFIQGTEEQE